MCEKIKTLELGHESGSSIAFFHKPDLAKTDRTVATHFSKYGTKIGVEFVRKYNRAAVAGVVSALPLGSLIFATIWMAIYLREPEELQAKITTAFTVSTYLMTTGM